MILIKTLSRFFLQIMIPFKYIIIKTLKILAKYLLIQFEKLANILEKLKNIT